MIAGLLFAEQDTTSHQFGRTVELLANHPGQWALLAARPDLAAAAIGNLARSQPPPCHRRSG
jgi:cytochrome P450